MKINKGFVQQLFGMFYTLLALGAGFRRTKVSTIAWLRVSDALEVVPTATDISCGDGNNAEGAQVEAPFQSRTSHDGGENVKKTQAECAPPGQKGDVDDAETAQEGAPLAVQERNTDHETGEMACGDGTNEAVPVEEDKHVLPSAASTQRAEKRRQAYRQLSERRAVTKELSASSVRCGGDFDQTPSPEASTSATEDTQSESSSSSVKSLGKRIARLGIHSRNRRKGAERSPSEGSSGTSAACSGRNPPAVCAAARAIASHIMTLLDPLWPRQSSSAGLQTKNRIKFSISPHGSIKRFLPSLPRRPGGLLQPIGCHSPGSQRVLRYVIELFPLKIRSALHKGSTQSLVINFTCPIVHSRGRLSVCVDFQHDTSSSPLLLTVLFVEDGMPLGRDVSSVLNRVAAAQHIATKAGLSRPIDVAKHFRLDTPLDVVPISKEDSIDLGTAVVAGNAILERCKWAPLSTVLLRMDQADGRKNIRIAEQARTNLTGQVLEVVSAIRTNKIVLPRLTVRDFWLDRGGSLFFALQGVSDVLAEEKVTDPSRTAGEIRPSQGTRGEASHVTESNASQGLDDRSNSVSLALLLLEMWCTLTPEQIRARTPAREAAAQQIKLEFSGCLSSFPAEVKELVTLLHGGIGRPGLPIAEVVSSDPFKILQGKLRRMEELERQARRNREAAQRSRAATRRRDSSTQRNRVRSVLYTQFKKTVQETRSLGNVTKA